MGQIKNYMKGSEELDENKIVVEKRQEPEELQTSIIDAIKDEMKEAG